MNAKFSLPLVILLSHLSSPSPWYYHGLCPHHHGFTVDFIPISAVTFIPITTVLPQLPRIYHCPYPHAALYRQPRPVCTRVHCASLQPTQLNTRQRMDSRWKYEVGCIVPSEIKQILLRSPYNKLRQATHIPQYFHNMHTHRVIIILAVITWSCYIYLNGRLPDQGDVGTKCNIGII